MTLKQTIATTAKTIVTAPFQILTNPSTSKTLTLTGITLTAGLGFYLKRRLKMIGRDEQLFIETATETKIINGPKVHLMPLVTKSHQVKKAISLSKLQYCVVQNDLTGEAKTIIGPKLLYLEPYCKIRDNKIHEIISLMKNEFIRFKDNATGKIRVILGEQGSVIPTPTEVFYDTGAAAPLGKRQMVDLRANEYCYIENKQTGNISIFKGIDTSSIHLKAFEEFVQPTKRQAIALKKNQYTIIENTQTSSIRSEKGEQLIFLDPFEKCVDDIKVREAVDLKLNQYLQIENSFTGEIKTVRGETLYFREPLEVIKDNRIHEAIILKNNEYCKIENKRTGEVRIEKGEQMLFLEPFEVALEGGKQKAIDLTCYQYTKILNKKTGQLRTEKGEKLVFPGPFDEILGSPKNNAIEVDEETAVLIRNKRTGKQTLVQEQQLFIPADDEEIIEPRKLIKLADYEACIVRGKDGKDKFYYGKNENERSFFLPPYSELVELRWSRGRRREKRDLYITKIDTRPMFMSFEFNCRTSDNVELILEGTLFWEIFNPESMVKFTGDTSGDVCAHARSQFIQCISKVKLEEFMADFNKIAEKAHSQDDDFYSKRGCLIHSLEVTGYSCAEKSTSKVLEQIIQETTNRMNKLQQQESRSEVQLMVIKGQIDEEKARSELLTIQSENSSAKAEMEGVSEAARVKKFIDELEGNVPDLETRIQLWRTLRRGENLESIGKGNVKMFLTPGDCDLKFDMKVED